MGKLIPGPTIILLDIRIHGHEGRFKCLKNGVPKGIRTPVAAVKGRCPRPLDDGDVESTGCLDPGLEKTGGARRDRTADLYNAIVALSQLSYGPTHDASRDY